MKKTANSKPQKNEIHELNKNHLRKVIWRWALTHILIITTVLAWQSHHFFYQIFNYIFQKNRQNWRKLFKQKIYIIRQSFVNQCTLFPNKILKGISKIFAVNLFFWGKNHWTFFLIIHCCQIYQASTTVLIINITERRYEDSCSMDSVFLPSFWLYQ
jgi:hypothetical protein